MGKLSSTWPFTVRLLHDPRGNEQTFIHLCEVESRSQNKPVLRTTSWDICPSLRHGQDKKQKLDPLFHIKVTKEVIATMNDAEAAARVQGFFGASDPA